MLYTYMYVMSNFVLLHATAVCHVLKLDERCGTGCDLIITVVCHGPSAQHTDGTAIPMYVTLLLRLIFSAGCFSVT